MRFFTSDLHLGHTNIIQYCDRPFEDTDDMTETLVSNWNTVVAPDDEVWVLGDVAMGRIKDSLPHVKRLNGTKILIPGNHDRCWEHAHTGTKFNYWMSEYQAAGFKHIFQGPVRLKIGGKDVMCSHFPYIDDERHGQDYADYQPRDRGMPLLHGHVHQSWRAAATDKGTLMLNIGVDVFDYEPVSELEIEAFL